ncbi:cytochrome P450 [Actinocrispum wychmicini]|uniref:Pentalenolactone synthase n=1 Tax=Actinocrispum wychmicini TaxID=1213861 RepID=A0A4R2IXU9_9PSEU|nr:cytochrome P450 [Actinocrispum wychmicini]TCO49792.1 pentalenolactone synthase [Actinocrispum wychmicini]
MIKTQTPTGDPAWLATDHAEVRRLLADERLGRSHPEPATAARTGASALFGGPSGNFETEHADHARMRSLLQPHFSPKRMRALRPRIQALTTELLDKLTPPTDLHAELALPLPILVICELLGVPYEDRDQFRQWTQDAANTVDGTRSQQGLAALFGYGHELVAKKRANPQDDVISQLAATEGVTDYEAATLSMTLLFAGHETTVMQIGKGAMLLLDNPDQWQALVDDPSLVPNAVEEILRAPRAYANKGGGIPRYARTEMQVGDATIHQGDLVLLSITAANEDPAVFPDPERVDVTRQTSAHLAFGHSIRYCLGAPLARIELTEVFTQLVTRFPTMRLAVSSDDLVFNTDTLGSGLTALPVTW